MALKAGLNLDSTYLEKMHTILTFGFKDELAVSQYRGNIKVTSYLSESYLRESKELFINKYGNILGAIVYIYIVVHKWRGKRNAHTTYANKYFIGGVFRG